MSFEINGREYKDYQLSNKQIRDLLKSDSLSEEERSFLLNKAFERFDYQLCPRNGEEDENVFARLFSDFINGKLYDYEKVADIMAHDHRYLQNEMFKLCMAYIKKLAVSYKENWFDPRNEYACKTSSKIIEGLKKIDWPY